MNKKIEDVFDLPPIESETNASYPIDKIISNKYLFFNEFYGQL